MWSLLASVTSELYRPQLLSKSRSILRNLLRAIVGYIKEWKTYVLKVSSTSVLLTQRGLLMWPV